MILQSNDRMLTDLILDCSDRMLTDLILDCSDRMLTDLICFDPLATMVCRQMLTQFVTNRCVHNLHVQHSIALQMFSAYYDK